MSRIARIGPIYLMGVLAHFARADISAFGRRARGRRCAPTVAAQ